MYETMLNRKSTGSSSGKKKKKKTFGSPSKKRDSDAAYQQKNSRYSNNLNSYSEISSQGMSDGLRASPDLRFSS